MKTLVISGSIRSREVHTNHIFSLVLECKTLEEYIRNIKAYQVDNSHISNSDILAGAVLMAMKNYGAAIDYYPLMKLFPRRETRVAYTSGNVIDSELTTADTLSLSENEFDDLKRRILESEGIVLVTPVYFGDRSSVANKLLQLSGMHNLLEDKVFGTVSVGAKRNGGQETTIIYSLFEALNQNAVIVGNGPPTSQYGGTAVGGKKGTVIDDEWGLVTSYGTGTRVAHVSDIIAKGRHCSLDRPVRILVLIAMDDTKQILFSFLQDFLERAEEKLSNIEFKVANILNSTIYRCLGCDSCPAEGPLPIGERPTKEKHAHCVIQNREDAMGDIHHMLLEADGIIIAGLNVKQHDQLIYRYQALTERTRYIRRDHFELTNKVITAFSLSQVGARINSLHSLKTITSYVRHNTIIHKPIEAFIYMDDVLDDGMEDLLHFARFTEVITAGKREITPMHSEYTTKGIGGY